MSMTLGGVNIDGLIYDDELTQTGVRSEVTKTLAGGIVVWEQTDPSGREITLSGGSDYGWLARSVIISLRALAAVPGATYALVLPGETVQVRFRNETPPPVEATPIIPRPNPDNADWYNQITIKLMEV